MDPRLGPLRSPVVSYLEPDLERLSKEEIRQLQLELFNQDLERAWASPFYAPRYRAARLEPGPLRTLEDVIRIPVIRKQDILADLQTHPPYGARLVMPESAVVQVVESSGTSGKGREVQALTVNDVQSILRCKMFQFFWPGGRAGTPVALNVPVTMAAGALWSLGALERLRCNVLRIGTLESEARLEVMKRYGVEILTASSPYLMRLEHVAAQAGYDLQRDFPRLRSICLITGGWTPQWAEARAERWNARLFETYGVSQRGFAYSCEQGVLRDSMPGVLHGIPYLCLLEVIDPESARHVEPGQEGEIVLTFFGQEAAPLIRFATGDRARYLSGEACRCGRAFDGIEAGSVSRYDDMMKIKGINVYPDTVDRIVLGVNEVAEYRGEVFIGPAGRETARIQVEFRPEVPPARREERLQQIERDILRSVGLHFVAEAWDGPSLLVGASGGFRPDTLKVRRWSNRRDREREAATASGGSPLSNEGEPR